MLLRRPAALPLTALAILALPALADEPQAAKVTYKEVSAVFQNRCNGCHNADKKKGGLILDNYTTAIEGGASGQVVEPGDPDNSRLYLLVAHDEEPKMPPNAPRIPDPELALIRLWIEGGALESAAGAVAMAKPKLDFKLDPSAVGKPVGEPAMPRGVSTDPVVVSPRPNAITALAASPWAPLVAVSGHKQVLLFNTTARRLVGVLPFPEGTIFSLKFSRDGGVLLVGGGRGGQLGRAVGFDVATGERLFEVGKEYDVVLSADLSPDRSLVALGGPSKVLRVYNTSDGELAYECKKHTEWVTAVAFSPDGVLLASGDRNGGLIVWEAPTGREFYDLRGHGALISDLSWRLDSNLLASASEDGSIRLWEMQNGGNVKNWGAHGGGALSVRFAKDGRLVSHGRDRVPKVWDQNGAAQKQLEASADVGLQAAFTFDDQAIVSGDFTGEVRLHDLAEGKRLGTLPANPAPVAVRLDQARQALAAAQAESDAASAGLAALQGALETQTAAEAAAQEALALARQAAADASAKVAAASQDLAQKRAAEQAAADASWSAEFARGRSATLRDAALREVRDAAESARLAAQVAAASGTDRDRQLSDRAAAALASATSRAEATLPPLAAAIEAANPARLSSDQATAARVVREASLPALQAAFDRESATLPILQASLDSASAAKVAAGKAVAERAPSVEALAARVAVLRVEVEALAAEAGAKDAVARNQGSGSAPAQP